MSPIQVDLHHSQSEFRSLSHPAEVCSRLERSEPVNSSTRPHPSSLSTTGVCYLCLRSLRNITKSAAKNVRNNLSWHWLLCTRRMKCMGLSTLRDTLGTFSLASMIHTPFQNSLFL
ncbi:uncharacterized protein LOC131334034 isoform X4 [Rhododendron vialii]|uniref:uncharacterized protein LOC131334034 isoform X4 n=1 Tax=Rhododendron vialii TaxID=182163 RepID=UPI00265F8D48|nr:uncharacterized protein LOC131334034 isoform X4 [Rhododendron vialii]